MGYMLGVTTQFRNYQCHWFIQKVPAIDAMFFNVASQQPGNSPDFPAGDVKKQRVKRLKTAFSQFGENWSWCFNSWRTSQTFKTSQIWNNSGGLTVLWTQDQKTTFVKQTAMHCIFRRPESDTHQRQSIDDDVETVEAKFNNSHCNTFLKPISYRSVEFWGRNKHSINSIRSISWSLHDICQNWVPPSPFSRDLQHIQQIHGTTLPNSQPSPVFLRQGFRFDPNLQGFQPFSSESRALLRDPSAKAGLSWGCGKP